MRLSIAAILLCLTGAALAQVALPQPHPGDQVVVFESEDGDCKYTIYGSPEGLVVVTSSPACQVIVGHEREARL